MTTSPSTLSSDESPPLGASGAAEEVNVIELKPGLKISVGSLRTILPDVETLLFFGKLFSLDYSTLSYLITTLFKSDVITELFGKGCCHSTELQGYIVSTVPEEVRREHGNGSYSTDVPAPNTELLGQLVESASLQIASSIQEVGDALVGALSMMSSKYGQMTFQHLHKLNVQRNAIGTFGPTIVHQHTPPRLVIFDVSGSMSQPTVQTIVDEVVGMAYAVNADLAIVSNSCYWWEAGTYDVDTVLQYAEYGGTHYEQLRSVLDREWDTVITIADYDSSYDASRALRTYTTKAKIGKVYDLSLVDRPTFLSECVGQFASSIETLLVGNSSRVLGNQYW